MTDDRDAADRDGFEVQDAPDDAGDPAAAFDALRKTVKNLDRNLQHEMIMIRKDVEVAFDKFDREGRPADYKPQLAQLVQEIGAVVKHVRGIEQSPVLRHGAEHYGAALKRSGESLVRTAAQQLERQSIDLERTAKNLARHVAGARERRQQNHWLWGIGVAGLVAGVLLTLFAPRVLPGSVDTAVASTVMNADRWSAGEILMNSDDPERWRTLDYVRKLARANKDALTRCGEAAATAKKAQNCTILVSAPKR